MFDKYVKTKTKTNAFSEHCVSDPSIFFCLSMGHVYQSQTPGYTLDKLPQRTLIITLWPIYNHQPWKHVFGLWGAAQLASGYKSRCLVLTIKMIPFQFRPTVAVCFDTKTVALKDFQDTVIYNSAFKLPQAQGKQVQFYCYSIIYYICCIAALT